MKAAGRLVVNHAGPGIRVTPTTPASSVAVITGASQGRELAAPTAAHRIETLDILRSVALMGMIIVHFFKMARPALGMEGRLGWFISMMVETKAWAIFAILFGMGFAILMRRAEGKKRSFTSLYVRRIIVLGAIGIAAPVFFGAGILLDYALWGLPILLVRKWSARRLLFLAVLAASAGPIYGIGRQAVDTAIMGRAAATVAAEQRTDEVAMQRAALREAETEGAYTDLVRARVNEVGDVYLDPEVLIPGASFALFLLGLLAVRYGIIEHPRKHVGTIVSMMIIGLVSWASFWWLLPILPAQFTIGSVAVPVRGGLGIIRDQWLAFLYVGAIVLVLAYWPEWIGRLRGFGAVGRMALTNYVIHGVVLDYLASGYGMGLSLRPYALAMAALGLFVAQMMLSRVWLAHFRRGPLEWLWRRLSYGEPQPMRLSVPVPGSGR